MAIECPECKAKNPDRQSYCGDCGTPLPDPKKAVHTKTIETPTKDLTRGAIFAGRYEIIEELGKGGMGRVYRVEDTKTQDEIALKLLKPEIATDKKTIERFRNELTTARKIRHKNVCGMFDLGEEKGLHFITMEYVPGEDLKSFIKRSGQLTVGKTISVARQVCDGLTEAHSLGIVHRDLKPSNIMIDKGGNARIMDFGIARAVKGKSITGSGVMIGTPEYMSPEQVEGKEVDPRSDIYSLGIILYEMLTARVPFEGDTPLTVGVKQKSELPKDPKELNSQIPDDLNQVILRCLHKEKHRRYQNAEELRSELENIEKGLPTTQKVVPKQKALTSREITVTFGLRKLWIPAVAVLVAAAVAIGVWLLFFKKEISSMASGKPSLAVMYFENRTQVQDLDKILVDMLTTNLSRVEGIEVVSSQRLFDILRQLGKQDIGAIDRSTATQVATQAGVNTMLTGSVIQVGGKVRITSNLIDVGTGTIIGSEQVEGDKVNEDVFAMVDVLTEKMGILMGLFSEGTNQSLNIVDVTTDSFEAYRQYQKGLDDLMRFKTSEAVGDFQKAIDIDPTFVMAYVRLATAQTIYGNRTLDPFFDTSHVVDMLETAKRYSHKATEKERMKLDVQLAQYKRRNYESVTSLAEKLIEEDPTDKDGYFYLMGEYFFNEDPQKIKKLSNRILEIDPTDGNAYNMLAYANSWLNNVPGVRSAIKKYIALQPNDYNPYDSAWETLMTVGQYDEAIAFLEEGLQKNSGWNQFHQYIGTTFLLQGEGEKAREKYDIYARSSLAAKVLAIRFMGFSYLFEGRYHLAENEFRRAVALAVEKDDPKMEMHARLDLGRILALRRKYTEAFEEYDAAIKASRKIYSGKFNPLPLLTDYLKGMDLAQKGDYQKVQDKLKSLKTKIQEFNEDALYQDFYHLLRGELYFVQENGERLQNALEKASIAQRFSAHYRRLAAAGYELQGDLENAIEEYRRFYNDVTLAAYSLPEHFYFFRESSLVNYNIAKIHERSGHEEEAKVSYQKFLDLWKDADPGLPEVEDARNRLSALKKF